MKVLDFGLAKAIGGTERKPDASQATTITGAATSAWQIVGTPGYMSPEQARGTDVDQRADIWAFGCLAFRVALRKARIQRGERFGHHCCSSAIRTGLANVARRNSIKDPGAIAAMSAEGCEPPAE